MPTAVVVGGGLAGMVIAGELASRQWWVTLLERSPRLGGKAGSDLQNGRRVEHGYHVFPQWYPNVHAIQSPVVPLPYPIGAGAKAAARARTHDASGGLSS